LEPSERPKLEIAQLAFKEQPENISRGIVLKLQAGWKQARGQEEGEAHTLYSWKGKGKPFAPGPQYLRALWRRQELTPDTCEAIDCRADFGGQDLNRSVNSGGSRVDVWSWKVAGKKESGPYRFFIERASSLEERHSEQGENKCNYEGRGSQSSRPNRISYTIYCHL
jgi:hypothetical protein